MGKAKRLKVRRRGVGGEVLDARSARLTANFQRALRQSERWDQIVIVAEFGEQRMEEILRECRADVWPGWGPDERGDRPTHRP